MDWCVIRGLSSGDWGLLPVWSKMISTQNRVSFSITVRRQKRPKREERNEGELMVLLCDVTGGDVLIDAELKAI